MTEHDHELRPAYRTLNDPARLLGISIGGWIALLIAAACGYAWLLVSPLGWRANVSIAVVALGTPAALLLLREESTVSPGRVLVAVLRWRLRSAVIGPVTEAQPARGGGVRVDETPASLPTDVAQPWPVRRLDDDQ